MMTINGNPRGLSGAISDPHGGGGGTDTRGLSCDISVPLPAVKSLSDPDFGLFLRQNVLDAVVQSIVTARQGFASTALPRGGEVGGSCSADSHGNAGCEVHASIRF